MEFLIKRRWPLFIALVLLTAGIGSFAGRIGIDNSLNVWFVDDDPALLAYEEFQALYGNDEVVLIWLPTAGDPLNGQYVRKVHELSERLEAEPLVRRVLSLSHASYLGSRDDELIIENMASDAILETFERDAFEARLRSSPALYGLLLGGSRNGSVVLVEPYESKDFDLKRPELMERIAATLGDTPHRLAGMGVTYNELNRVSIRDSTVFTGVSYLLLVLALFFFFRKWRLLLFTLLTLLLAVPLFLGVLGVFRYEFTMVSAILPSLVIILGLADIVHIFTHHNAGTKPLAETLKAVGWPCLFTTVTTAIGFSSLAASPMGVLKGFGIFAAVGAFVALLVTFGLAPVILGGPTSSAPTDGSSKKADLFDRLLTTVNGLVQRRPGAIVLGVIPFVVIAAYGISQIVVDTYSIDFLLDSNEVKEASEVVERDYGPYLPLELRLAPKEGTIKDAAFLGKLDQLKTKLEARSDVGNVGSVADVVKLLNRALTDGGPSSYSIPDDNRAIAQELLLYDMNPDNDLQHLTTDDFTEARFTARVPMQSSQAMKMLLQTVRADVNEVFADSATLTFGGYGPLYVVLIDYVVDSQVRSFALAFGVVFLAILLLFRSLPFMLLGIIPNLLPVVFTLGLMGLTGIRLDIATVTIAAVVLGICVDDTIHFLFTYQRNRRSGLPPPEAVTNTLRTSGKAIIVTSLLLICGYLVMVLASVKSVIFMGLLVSFCMAVAVVCDLLVLPSLILVFWRKQESRRDVGGGALAQRDAP